MNDVTKERKIELDDMEALLRIPAGRRFLARLLEYSGVFQSSFDPDPMKMAKTEGGRGIGMFVWDELKEANLESTLELLRDIEHV